jgi:hypothetical protein
MTRWLFSSLGEELRLTKPPVGLNTIKKFQNYDLPLLSFEQYV